MVERERSMRWDTRLTPQGWALVEARRSRYVKRYDELRVQGYYVVGEVSPHSGRLLRRGTRPRITLVQELVAREEIEQFEEIDTLRGRRREYEWTEGAVFPAKQSLHPGRIRLPEHIRAYKNGITIFAREDTLAELSIDSEVDKIIASIFHRHEGPRMMSDMLQSTS